MTIDNSNEPIKVDRLNVEVTDVDVRGANALGSVIKALGDFFTGGAFYRCVPLLHLVRAACPQDKESERDVDSPKPD